MLTPAIFGDYLMDDWFDDLDREFFGKKNPLYGRHAKNLMKTDVREHENSYELDIDLPGFKKEDVQLTLENGYLSIMAGKNLDKEEKEKKSGRLIRQERYSGSLARSFYVGEDLTEEDIKAKMEHGVLKLVIPKKEHKEEIPEKKTIMIE
jgi:HSP20 family molecular chaperone IbpA